MPLSSTQPLVVTSVRLSAPWEVIASPEQSRGDVVAVVLLQVVGGAVHLKLALFFFLNCVSRQAHDVPFPLELQGAEDGQSPGMAQEPPSLSVPAGTSGQPSWEPGAPDRTARS